MMMKQMVLVTMMMMMVMVVVVVGGIVTFVLDVTVFRNGSLGSWGFKFAAKCQR